jgi:signal transduction histidine kinase
MPSQRPRCYLRGMSEWRSLVERARRFNPTVADALLGAFLLVISLPQLFVEDPTYRHLGITFRAGSLIGVLLLAAETMPLTWRRRYPRSVLAAMTASAFVLLVAGFRPTVADLGLVIAVYSVAGHSSRRSAVIAGLAFLVALAGLIAIADLKYPQDQTEPQQYIVNFASFAFAWFLGVLQRNRREHTAKLEALNRQLAEERESRARWAVSEERSRIARELHDVIAHTVSVMVVQAGAARRVAATRPEQARDAMTSIESTGRQALGEMRRLVGVLRNSDEPTTLDPQPRLADVPALVEQARKAGLDVELDVWGEPRPLPAGVDLSAYRIVQEALTNVRKHAGPASVQVQVRYGPQSLHIEVADDGRSSAAHAGTNGNRGQGLIGMRERVALYGGKLEVGRTSEGGFRVLADLPLEAAAT